MIAVCDEGVNAISSDEAESTRLAYRDYMQKLYSTGTYQITDAFVSGADHSTINYTIAIPIKKDNKVKALCLAPSALMISRPLLIIPLKMIPVASILTGSDNVIMAAMNLFSLSIIFQNLMPR